MDFRSRRNACSGRFAKTVGAPPSGWDRFALSLQAQGERRVPCKGGARPPRHQRWLKTSQEPAFSTNHPPQAATQMSMAVADGYASNSTTSTQKLWNFVAGVAGLQVV